MLLAMVLLVLVLLALLLLVLVLLALLALDRVTLWYMANHLWLIHKIIYNCGYTIR